MIALMILIATIVWLALVIFLCIRIPVWMGASKNRGLVGTLLFPVILVLPFADEFIGRWQFDRLCEREVAIFLDPNWRQVKRAKFEYKNLPEKPGYIFTIHVVSIGYIDIDTGNLFLSRKRFLTKGGFIFRNYLRFDDSNLSCTLDDSTIKKQIDISKLITQGGKK